MRLSITRLSNKYMKQQPVPPKAKAQPVRKSKLGTLFKWFLGLCALGAVAVVGVALWIQTQIVPGLPDIKDLKEVKFEVPLRIYTSDGLLISEYGEKRRVPVDISRVPQKLIDAFVSVEDDRFFEHPGVDYQGLLRAFIQLVKTGKKGQGGSTITMQVARNFYLSREKTYSRKLNEILLALKIESKLSKMEILELYLNKIFFGHRAYGAGAAAQVYYGRRVDELTLAQMAMIAGLPQAPSAHNPISNPERAIKRRNHVLARMYHLNKITEDEYSAAVTARVTAKRHKPVVDLEAPYVAEIARQFVFNRFGNEAYRRGLTVRTTVHSSLQQAANDAVMKGLLDYEKRHGYTGPVDTLDSEQMQTVESVTAILQGMPSQGSLTPALVIHLTEKAAIVTLPNGVNRELFFKDIKWAAPRQKDGKPGKAPKKPSDVLNAGDIIYLEQLPDQSLRLAQAPGVEAALVSLDPNNGRILAMVGGFDYYRSKFNRVLLAKRQAGSNIKPFIYSAAIDKGDTAASIYNDAPVVFRDSRLEAYWRPSNYSGRVYGPTRLREALVKSRNLVSVRLLRELGVRTAISYAERFGFNRADLPRDLSLSLGSGSVTPLDMATAYSVFANGGYKVKPFTVSQVEDANSGEVVYQNSPLKVCKDPCRIKGTLLPAQTVDGDAQFYIDKGIAPRAIEARNAYIMRSILRDVIKQGTAKRALALKRDDIGGKTGTSNDQVDAWFSGFNSQIVATSWMGYDDNSPLGNKETGARAALPIWIDFMKSALAGMKEDRIERPEGMVELRIDARSGELAGDSSGNALNEVFRQEYAPTQFTRLSDDSGRRIKTSREEEKLLDQLF